MKHPVLLTSHNYQGLTSQIGHFEDVHIDHKNKQVIATAKYYVGEGNPEADWGWKLVEKGIAAYSIGFRSLQAKYYPPDERTKDDPILDYLKIELLEASHVLIPANPSALQRSLTAEGEDPFLRELAEEIYSLMKDELPPDPTPETAKPEEKTATEIEAEQAPTEKNTDQRVKDIELQLNATHLMLVDVKAYVLKLMEGRDSIETELTVSEGIVPDPALKDIKDQLTLLLEKFPPKVETPAPVKPEEVSTEKAIEEEEEDIQEILSEEKLLEFEETLRRSLSDDQGINVETVKSLLDSMTEEVSRAFSGQPKGNGVE
jgi:hypothetical protein